MNKVLSSATAIIVGLFILFLIVFQPMTIVGVGERGVKVTLGQTSPVALEEGVHFVMPFISTVKKMNVKTVKSNIATMAQSKDIQQARIVYVVNYNLQPENAPKMWRTVGRDYVSVVVFKLNEKLGPKYINVSDFQITEIQYSQAFEQAIESKVTAEQEALKAKNKTVQVQEEARQKIIASEAEAKSMAIRAQALTQNKNLVEYEAVQKWDGKLPQYMMGNSVPFVNLK